MTLKAYKTEIIVNNKQQTLLLQHIGCARWAYNWALASLMGPALGIVLLCCFWEDITDKMSWLPKIRNPFVWPEKHD